MTEYFEPEMGQAIFGQPYQGLGCPGKPGRAAGAIVQKEDHPKLYQMYQDGYLNSEIGQRFGVSGTTAGKLIRKYEASMGGGQ